MNNTEEVLDENCQSVTKLTGMKNAILQVTYFLNGPMVNLLLFVILFYIERKWLYMRNLATILPLQSILTGKFQRFYAIDRGIKMLKNS